MTVVEGEIEEQAKQALANMKAVVEASGSSVDKVAKTTVRFHTLYKNLTYNDKHLRL